MLNLLLLLIGFHLRSRMMLGITYLVSIFPFLKTVSDYLSIFLVLYSIFFSHIFTSFRRL